MGAGSLQGSGAPDLPREGGCSPFRAVFPVCLESPSAAMRQLARGKKPLCAIALDAGFVDQSHFYRVFKRCTGRTPTQYASVCR